MKRLENDPHMAAAKLSKGVFIEGTEILAGNRHIPRIGSLEASHYHQQGRFA
jgi:hypothetical protein